MKYHESYSDSQALLEKALRFLDQYQLAYNPVFYAVAYQHMAGNNLALSGAIEQAIAAGKFDPYGVEQLFEQFIESQSNDNAPDFDELGSTIDKLQGAAEKNGVAVDALDKELGNNYGSASSNPEPIVAITKSIVDGQKKLMKQVAKAKTQSEQIKAELAAAKLQAVTDPLTSLQNRNGLEIQFKGLLGQGQKQGIYTGLLDLDHFKNFNDSYGHLVGDLILKRIGKLLKEELPNEATPFRFGGEEFVMLLTASHIDAAISIAEEIRYKVEKLRFKSAKTKERLPQLTISIGLSQWSHGETLEEVLIRADEALYQAKNEGRNLVKFSYVEARD